LELLDQRFLPDKTVYVTCRTAEQVAKAIRDMAVRGAPAIGCAAAFGVVLGKGSAKAHAVLRNSRPTAVNLFWALERMQRAKDLEAEAKAIYDEDLAANRATSFTRTLSSPARTGGEWNGFASIGDLWRVSPTFSLLYGARIEANAFTSAPAYNPAVEQAFGARTDHAPDTWHASPRLGFTWVRRNPGNNGALSINRIGAFNLGPTSYLRGGIGEFRNLLAPSLLSGASVASRLRNSPMPPRK